MHSYLLAEAVAKLSSRLPAQDAGVLCLQAAQHTLDRITKSIDTNSPSLMPALGHLLERLKSEEAEQLSAEAARLHLDVITSQKKANPATPLLVRPVSQLAPWLPPSEASKAARQILDLLLSTGGNADACAEALQKLTARLQPAEAARISDKAAQHIFAVMVKFDAYKDAGANARAEFRKMLSLLAERMSPTEAALMAQSFLDQMTSAALYPYDTQLLGNLANRCSEQTQIDLMKHPCCVVDGIGDVLRISLNQRLKQNFATRLQLVRWLRQHRPDLDLDSPPTRLSMIR
jgi:hypothetical protein